MISGREVKLNLFNIMTKLCEQLAMVMSHYVVNYNTILRNKFNLLTSQIRSLLQYQMIILLKDSAIWLGDTEPHGTVCYSNVHIFSNFHPQVALCREVFRDTLNESRDVDRGTSDRYSARFFLKHTFIEQAFDALQEAGFRMVGSAGSGTNSAGDMKPGMDSEECKWNHYNEFIFCR